jgi:prepilin-type processing-associated H-X9-DG protein
MPPSRRYPSSPPPAAAFSLVELLVVIGIVVLLLSILIPYFSRLTEIDRRTRCANQLRDIQAGLQAYASANSKQLPRVLYDPSKSPSGYVAYTGADAQDPFVHGSKVRANDVTASLWLLVRGGYVQPKRFACPSAPEWADPLVVDGKSVAAGLRGNFASRDHLSYSYASPFSAAAGYRLNTDWLKGDFAVLADKNPGVLGAGDNVAAPAYDAEPFQLSQGNSNNHNKAGQNVLYADGHVAFLTTPYCGVGAVGLDFVNGVKRDNIYTALELTPLPEGSSPPVEGNGYYGREIGPAWSGDSYLVPTDDE